MSILSKLKTYQQQTKQRKAFLFALGKYFLDISFNNGQRSQWILNELEASKAFAQHTGRTDEAQGIQAAIKIIENYRAWEGKTWKGQ